jgi:hypothetical protein
MMCFFKVGIDNWTPQRLRSTVSWGGYFLAEPQCHGYSECISGSPKRKRLQRKALQTM